MILLNPFVPTAPAPYSSSSSSSFNNESAPYGLFIVR